MPTRTLHPMRWNPALDDMQPYVGGKPIEEVAREYGVRDVIKLASNESPTEPFPEVLEVIREHAGSVHRYPDDRCHALGLDAAERLGIPSESLWFGGGSGDLMGSLSTALGGGGSEAVFGVPSFGLYPVFTTLAGGTGVGVALDDEHRLDLGAMHDAIGDRTSVVYVCNPNNPTGTHRSAADVEAFIAAAPPEVLVVVDEAYAEYVTAHDWGTMIPVALARPNVVVLRTFSKIYGLAGLRIGYAVGQPDTLAGLRRAQRPFTVGQLAQAAAREALRYPGRVEQRRLENDRGRRILFDGLTDRGLGAVPSQANFVYCDLGAEQDRIVEELLRKGVIIRTYGGGWSRVSVGTELENRRFLMALDTSL